MSHQTTQPKWKTLNEARTPGEISFYPKYEGESCVALVTRNTIIADILGSFGSENMTPEQAKANAAYLTLAANNLHDVAVALERLLDRIKENGLADSFPMAYNKAKEALQKIS